MKFVSFQLCAHMWDTGEKLAVKLSLCHWMLTFLIEPLINCDTWIPLQATVSCSLCVCFLIPLSHFCLFILMSITGQNLPSFQGSSVNALLFDFVLSLFYLLSGLAALTQTGHKQKKRGLLNHLREQSEREKKDHRCSCTQIYLNWCNTPLFSKV